jgi:cardiolipin synthase
MRPARSAVLRPDRCAAGARGGDALSFALRVALVATTAALTSCATMLPSLTAAEREASRTARSISIVGPKGELVGPARERIVERLRAYEKSTPLERKLLLSNAYTGAPLTVGNATRILLDGPAAYRAMFDAIAAARDHVHLESYIFEEIEFDRRLSELLARKAREGVQVRVIYDSFGSLDTPPAFLEGLAAQGVVLCEFNPVNPLRARLFALQHRDHRKIVVVDGRIAFTGGINFHSVYRSGSVPTSDPDLGETVEGWRDTHLAIEGPAVAELQTMFLGTWEKQGCRDVPVRNHFPAVAARGDDIVSVIGSSPDGQLSTLYLTLVAAITYAVTSVHLSAAYFVPDASTIQALKAAAARGVDVRLLLPAFTDSWLAFHAGRSYYDELLAAGVHIHEYRGGVMHAKTLVVDGVWSTIGSANVDWRSFVYNDEVSAVVVGRAFGDEMERIFANDLAKSAEVTRERWSARSASSRLSEATARWFESQL